MALKTFCMRKDEEYFRFFIRRHMASSAAIEKYRLISRPLMSSRAAVVEEYMTGIGINEGENATSRQKNTLNMGSAEQKHYISFVKQKSALCGSGIGSPKRSNRERVVVPYNGDLG